ncbi:hypothetical protein CGCFRS4_v016069 [Colletotrichum fructicola]|nr:hypothetical protein CGCFRS4_v016069 [Colletotrichum fructicola]
MRLSIIAMLIIARNNLVVGAWQGFTPHAMYASSVGVLGCKINYNRVAHWPTAVDCDNICVKISSNNRSVHVLKIDISTGAHDISYDAWNYLVTGMSAVQAPVQGGPIWMEYEYVHPENCVGLLSEDGRLPLSASNSMNFLSYCRSQPESWVAPGP